MAQRKSPSTGKSPANKPGGGTSGKPGGGTSGKPGGATSNKPSGGAAGKPATRPSTARPTRPAAAKGTRSPAKKGKSIVNQKQTPWGMIISTIVVVAFAAAVVIVVVATHNSGSSGSSTTKGGQAVDKNDPYRQPELPAAAQIQGVTYRVEGQHTHVNGVIKYDASPPVGGNHSVIWANCDGAAYDHQIANENAVHMLEHGAVWITYNPKTLPSADLPKLKSYLTSQGRIALSPYAGLKTPISLQAWGYQLFVNSATDPRIAQFISTLMYNPKTTPENASCTDPYWSAAAAKASKLGHPVDS
jgi:Protein of unknown function (DUF3105)